MTAEPPPQGGLAERLREISTPDHCIDRAAKLQDLSETIWGLLDVEGEVDDHVLDSFVALLLDQQNFALASMVIPELRHEQGPEAGQSQRQHVLSCVSGLQRKIAMDKGLKQDDFDDALYRGEKEIYKANEMYRVKLLLNSGSAIVTRQDEEKLEKWWADRPF